ncbi:dephospho-CoA kinase [Winogradskyella sp. 3972H.M.0a.05]|uniref:dephospho-CoA kinase n=1 Tax=Winogradskyella sp. 3972H.M.0a.05 TaxID=2950277 RepID=UPI0033997C01
MKIIGLTGGIGSGKTTVANMFSELGAPVYIADIEAKLLMNRSKVIRRKLIALFGDKAYTEEGLNRSFIASMIFKDKSLLDNMNAIVHPKVASHFKRWLKKQDAQYIIKEAAIIFEHNKEKEYDYVITVVADKEDRIKRVLSRKGMSRAKAVSIMENQLDDGEKIKRSDFVIVNDSLTETKEQVYKLHKKLSSLT